LFGLVVWASSYLGWLPALHVLPSASHVNVGRNFMVIASHLVWGASLQVVCSALRRRLTGDERPGARDGLSGRYRGSEQVPGAQ
jgi:uncharacterized membrane protein YagU involved in acid resistance